MADPFIGEMRMVTWDWAPRNWALCQAQLLPISQHTALYAVIGTYFGGDGRVTVGMPDCSGRVPVGTGTGPGLTQWRMGERWGYEEVVVQPTQMNHGHNLRGSSKSDGLSDPTNNVLAVSTGSAHLYSSEASPTSVLHSVTVSSETGGGNPHDNMMPYQCMNYIISLDGIFPSRT